MRTLITRAQQNNKIRAMICARLYNQLVQNYGRLERLFWSEEKSLTLSHFILIMLSAQVVETSIRNSYHSHHLITNSPSRYQDYTNTGDQTSLTYDVNSQTDSNRLQDYYFGFHVRNA